MYTDDITDMGIMNNIYKSLDKFSPRHPNGYSISYNHSDEFMAGGDIITFDSPDAGIQVFLRNGKELTLSHTNDNKKVSYVFADINRVSIQRLSLLGSKQEIEIQYCPKDKIWADAFLINDGEIVSQYGIISLSNDPEKNVIYGNDNKISDLPFDGRFYRWTDGVDSYENSDQFSKIMLESDGLLSENMDLNSACETFGITHYELVSLPKLMIRKYNMHQRVENRPKITN